MLSNSSKRLQPGAMHEHMSCSAPPSDLAAVGVKLARRSPPVLLPVLSLSPMLYFASVAGGFCVARCDRASLHTLRSSSHTGLLFRHQASEWIRHSAAVKDEQSSGIGREEAYREGERLYEARREGFGDFHWTCSSLEFQTTQCAGGFN